MSILSSAMFAELEGLEERIPMADEKMGFARSVGSKGGILRVVRTPTDGSHNMVTFPSRYRVHHMHIISRREHPYLDTKNEESYSRCYKQRLRSGLGQLQGSSNKQAARQTPQLTNPDSVHNSWLFRVSEFS